MKKHSQILEDLFKPHKRKFVEEFFDRMYEVNNPNFDWESVDAMEFVHFSTYQIAGATEQEIIDTFTHYYRLKVFL